MAIIAAKANLVLSVRRTLSIASILFQKLSARYDSGSKSGGQMSDANGRTEPRVAVYDVAGKLPGTRFDRIPDWLRQVRNGRRAARELHPEKRSRSHDKD